MFSRFTARNSGGRCVIRLARRGSLLTWLAYARFEQAGHSVDDIASSRRNKKSPQCGPLPVETFLKRNALFNHGVCGMIVYGFEVLGFDYICIDAAILIQRRRDITHQILYEFWIIVRALGDIFFVRALEQTVKFTGSLLLGNAHQFFNPHMAIRARRYRHVRSLIVSAVFRDLLRTGT